MGGCLPKQHKRVEVSGSLHLCYPLTGAAVQAALPQSHTLKNTPTHSNEIAIYKGASSGWWSLVIVIHPKAFPGGKHGTVFPDQTWTLLRDSQTHCLVCTNISASDWTARPGSVFPCFTLLMHVYFYQPLWENCPVLWQCVADKEFLIKIEISTISNAPNLTAFQSSGMSRSDLETNCCNIYEAVLGFLHGCDERKPKHCDQKAITNICIVTN